MMKGKIDQYGFLWFERMRKTGAELIRAECHHTKKACGDYCAFFGEVVETESLMSMEDASFNKKTKPFFSLKICTVKLMFSVLNDERLSIK